jgi:hypothetical protein
MGVRGQPGEFFNLASVAPVRLQSRGSPPRNARPARVRPDRRPQQCCLHTSLVAFVGRPHTKWHRYVEPESRPSISSGRPAGQALGISEAGSLTHTPLGAAALMANVPSDFTHTPAVSHSAGLRGPPLKSRPLLTGALDFIGRAGQGRRRCSHDTRAPVNSLTSRGRARVDRLYNTPFDRSPSEAPSNAETDAPRPTTPRRAHRWARPKVRAPEERRRARSAHELIWLLVECLRPDFVGSAAH